MQRKPHVLILAAVALAACVVGAGCDRLKARDRLNKGVQAYKNGQFDSAIEDFKEAKELDPKLTNAQLYLATAYARLYIPGAPRRRISATASRPSRNTRRFSIRIPITSPRSTALARFSTTWPARLTIRRRLQESKTYHEKHIQLKTDDPEPYYWVGVIDWTLAFRANRDLREEYNKTAKKQIKENDPLPPAIASQFTAEVWRHRERRHFQPAEGH